MWSKLKRFVRTKRNDSLETLPLTPSEISDVPSTSSGITRNYGSIVTLLRRKLTLSSFQNQVIQ